MTSAENRNISIDKVISNFDNNVTSDWIDEFNYKELEEKRKILRTIIREYFNTIQLAVNRHDAKIAIPNLGKLEIKKYRKLFLDMKRNTDIPISDIVTTVKQQWYDEHCKKQ